MSNFHKCYQCNNLTCIKSENGMVCCQRCIVSNEIILDTARLRECSNFTDLEIPSDWSISPNKSVSVRQDGEI